MPNPLISNVKIVKKNIILGAPTRKGSLVICSIFIGKMDLKIKKLFNFH